MKIIERIYEELEKQNKSAADLARYLNVTTGQTTAWKQRKTDPPAKYLPKIAEFFNVSIDYILGQDNQNKDKDPTFALYDELIHDLSPEQIEQIKKFADFLRSN